MPTPKEIEEIRAESETILKKEGWYQFPGEDYYNYGYERGECSFVVKSSCFKDCFDEQFQEGYLPVIKDTMSQLEHTWLIYDEKREWVYFLEPELLSIQPYFVSPTCLYVLSELKSRKEELYEEIRKELLQEIAEGTYDESICVLSKSFRERIVKRKQKQEASQMELIAPSKESGP